MRDGRGKAVAAVSALGALSCLTATVARAQDTLRFEPFGSVMLYHVTQKPSNVVLFLSGDGGWNLGVVDMARSLSTLDALVVGIDVPRYLRNLESAAETCSYPPADLQGLGQYVQKHLGFDGYVDPVLVGYSSGATLAYTTLAQAPAGTFAGAISMGFCPDLTLRKPLCRQNELAWEPDPVKDDYRFRPIANVPAPWILLHGDQDRVCSLPSVEDFVRKVGGARLDSLPGVGHGFSVQRNWMPQFRSAFQDIVRPAEDSAAPLPPSVRDLPLTELATDGPGGGTMAVIVTGDGGWAGLDRQIGEGLRSRGIPVVGLSSLKYFWKPRTPDSAAADLARILEHYMSEWKKDTVLLVGYSYGAEVLPFMVNRLPPSLRTRVAVVALLAPGRTADFTFHLGAWLDRSGKEALPSLPDAKRLAVPHVLCFYGSDDKESTCPELGPPAEVVELPGGHHFEGNYQPIVARILATLGDRAVGGAPR